MATLRDIQRRIKAVKNTRQITKAMKMVAAAKLRKFQNKMLNLRPYADKMATVINSLATGQEQKSHPLLAKRPAKVVSVLVLTSDRGLCGAFNTNALKATTRLAAELGRREADTVSGGPLAVNICTVGRKARDYFKFKSIQTHKTWTGLSGNLSYDHARDIAGQVMQEYIEEKTDEVYLIYNSFKNMAQQEVRTVKMLPAEPVEAEGTVAHAKDFIFEPSEDQILSDLLPKNVEVQVFRALLESQASEEAARMTAMENATKSANEMIGRLTLQYNKARQASITGELMDIVGGVEALKG